jgi:regulator of ribonuclease activity B/immunity protein 26 of polymorphic toxin system
MLAEEVMTDCVGLWAGVWSSTCTIFTLHAEQDPPDQPVEPERTWLHARRARIPGEAMKLNYTEGTWFAVPLTSGGFGVGVVARATKKGRVILVYLFGPKREAVPPLSDVAGIDPSAAVIVARIGDLHLFDGKWPLLGRTPEWQRENWPMPMFRRSPPFLNHEYNVRYSDVDPSCVVSETKVALGTSTFDEDMMWGAGSVEFEMTKLLGGDAPRKADPIAPSAESAQPDGLPQGVRYYLYIPKRKKAEALAARLRGEGFEVETRRGADETNWLVLVSHPSLEEDTIDRLEEQFTKYAEASGGEYDGYER